MVDRVIKLLIKMFRLLMRVAVGLEDILDKVDEEKLETTTIKDSSNSSKLILNIRAVETIISNRSPIISNRIKAIPLLTIKINNNSNSLNSNSPLTINTVIRSSSNSNINKAVMIINKEETITRISRIINKGEMAVISSSRVDTVVRVGTE